MNAGSSLSPGTGDAECRFEGSTRASIKGEKAHFQRAHVATAPGFGLDIGKAHTVAVKSRGHFRSGFLPWFSPDRVYEVDTQGLTSPVLERIQFSHLPRPSYPLDESTQWTPPVW